MLWMSKSQMEWEWWRNRIQIRKTCVPSSDCELPCTEGRGQRHPGGKHRHTISGCIRIRRMSIINIPMFSLAFYIILPSCDLYLRWGQVWGLMFGIRDKLCSYLLFPSGCPVVLIALQTLRCDYIVVSVWKVVTWWCPPFIRRLSFVLCHWAVHLVAPSFTHQNTLKSVSPPRCS